MPDWKPQPKQIQAMIRKEFEILYGGARGGGKTEAGIVWLTYPEYRNNPRYRALTIRKQADDLKDWVDRAYVLYRRVGAKKVGTPPEFHFPSGAIIRTGHLRDEDAYEKYQGHEYQRMLIEELTQIPEEVRYLQLISSCRSTVDGLRPQVFCTTNPGGPGHWWVRARFIDPVPPGIPYTDPLSGRSRIFIPATVDDNPILLEKDPSYIQFLDSLPNGLREAWRYGSWDFVVGAAFPELSREKHLIDVSNPPARLEEFFDFGRMTPRPHIKIFRAMDWGYAKPFAVLWAFSDYDGRMYIYRELYGCKAANEGIQMPAREVAQKIREIEEEHNERITIGVADASIWDKPSNQNEKAERLPSIAETMAEEGIYWDREVSILAKKSRLQGKHQIHERLRVDADGLPHLFVFSTCVHWWRTVPVIPTDSLDPEDVDTNAEDHCYDATRYLCSARPMRSLIPKASEKPYTLAWFYKRMDMRRESVV